MKIVLGPWHPHLEDALADEIRQRRACDRLAPLLLVVPSDTLRRRIEVLLAQEHNLHLLNFELLTFSQLSLRLYQETHGAVEPTRRSGTFMEEALKRVIPAQGRFAGIADNDGACAALWQTLRDLKDAGVDPDAALDALREGLFANRHVSAPHDDFREERGASREGRIGNRDHDSLQALFELHREVQRRFPEWDARDRQDLDAQVVPLAPLSRWLGQFERIYYYGFYDLTQTQLDLLRSVASAWPVTLFYPLVRADADWSFAETFFDQYLVGLAGADEIVDLIGGVAATGDDAEAASPADTEHDAPDGGEPTALRAGSHPARDSRRGRAPRREELSCASPRDEVRTAAKLILGLVEEEGFQWSRVGVTARTLDGYLPWIREILPAHGIPFHTPARESLARSQGVRGLLALLELPVRDYPRAGVIDLLASHRFNFKAVLGPQAHARPDLWDVATRLLGIGRGMSEWRRLERFGDTGLAYRREHDEDTDQPRRIKAEDIRALLQAVEALHAELSALPPHGAWSELAGRCRALMDRFLVPVWDERERGMTGAIDSVLDELADLDRVAARVALPAFAVALRKGLERSSVPIIGQAETGVAVLDATAARGLPFDALFVLGMNEGTFPRAIREDPFLPDRARNVFQTALGYKVASKLAGYDEERLLFALLTSAAAKRLYCTWPREDAGERVLARSWYLEPDRLEPDGPNAISTDVATQVLPKSLLGRNPPAPFDQDRWLLPEELAVRRALSGKDPRPPLRAAGVSMDSFERSLNAVRALEDSRGAPGPFDGDTGPLVEAWADVLKRGVSPSMLEAYGRCPFQYFASRVLRLERLERPEGKAPVGALELGALCHEILEGFYEDAEQALRSDWRERLDRVAARVLSGFAERNPTGYPAAWEVAKEELVDLLRREVEADRQAMNEQGFRPVALELERSVDLAAALDTDWPEQLRHIRLQGRLDRVDYSEADGRYRIVDYKYKSGRKPKPVDQDPARSAIRGERLQLPLYVLLATGHRDHRLNVPATAQVDAAWHFFGPRWEDGPLSTREFEGQSWREAVGEQIRDTMTRLLTGVRAGAFPMVPGEYCDHCQVSEICRAKHLPSAMRARRHPTAEALTQMRKAKPV